MITLSVILALLDLFAILRTHRKSKEVNTKFDMYNGGLISTIIMVLCSTYLAVYCCYLIVTYLP